MGKETMRKKMLVSMPHEYRKLIFQPNTITKAQYSFTLLQERIFIYIMFALGEHSEQVRNGTYIEALELYSAPGNKDYIELDIPLRMIAEPSQYGQVRANAVKMQSTQMRIVKPRRKEQGGDLEWVESLFTKVTTVDASKKSNGFLPIRISKIVSQLLLNITYKDGRPEDYTSFFYDIAMISDNKYTPRIYKLLSRFKDFADTNEPYRMQLEDFREWLQLGDKYKDYADIKRRILVPVQAEIKEIAEFYFELSESRKDGKAVSSMNFIIKTRDAGEKAAHEWKLIQMHLRKIWKLEETYLFIIDKIRIKYPWQEVKEKIQYSWDYMNKPDVMKNPAKYIKDPAKFIYGVLIREFPV
jgi:plasmid replication initiation protein